MQEKVKTTQVRQNQNQIRQKKQNTPTNKVKANNMKLLLHVHSCKLTSMSMHNNKMIL